VGSISYAHPDQLPFQGSYRSGNDTRDLLDHEQTQERRKPRRLFGPKGSHTPVFLAVLPSTQMQYSPRIGAWANSAAIWLRVPR